MTVTRFGSENLPVLLQAHMAQCMWIYESLCNTLAMKRRQSVMVPTLFLVSRPVVSYVVWNLSSKNYSAARLRCSHDWRKKQEYGAKRSRPRIKESFYQMVFGQHNSTPGIKEEQHPTYSLRCGNHAGSRKTQTLTDHILIVHQYHCKPSAIRPRI